MSSKPTTSGENLYNKLDMLYAAEFGEWSFLSDGEKERWQTVADELEDEAWESGYAQAIRDMRDSIEALEIVGSPSEDTRAKNQP